MNVEAENMDSDGPPCFTDVGILRKIGFLIFETTKPAFNQDVVCPAAFSIHALTDMVFFEKCYVLGACKLTSLIRVQNQGFCHLESFFQRVYDHSGVQGIIYLPANNTTAIPVNDGCQIQEAVLDGDIGDVD